MGGLGNQMFQCAAGRALALHLNTPLKLDDSFLKQNTNGVYTQRHFDLQGFEMVSDLIETSELQAFFDKYDSKFTRFINRNFKFKTHILNENGHQYQNDFYNVSKNTLIKGFWQSEKYFVKFEEQIRKDFVIKAELLSGTEEWMSKIIKSNSVSIHVRRGDYVTNFNSNNFHGICSLDYYEKAVHLISSSNLNVELFVFSDDIEWCKLNMKFKQPTFFIETNSSYQDLFLMQNCKHNVIANSSFSWWGAWLNKNSKKIVVAPKNWFKNTSVNISDVIPADWIKI